ncbi:hypothetical protein MYX75_00730 [Acidobacteria bacterium AH-259-A15]|nr:hypothetical protein [Acidobacteria bacterium AH-259-A15]
MKKLKTLLAALALAATAAGGLHSSPYQSGAEADIDSFMKEVLEKRSTNWEALQTYVFREDETLDLKGLDIPSLESFRREYVWFYRDGYLIRSLVRVNDVKVSGREQAKSEARWKRKKGKGEESLRSKSFFDFKFEPGNYFFAGREEFQDREVVVVEYYPEKLFDDEDEKNDPYEKAFKKTTLVRMWILPENHQLVKITFENVGLEFLPYRWLVRFDELQAGMTMDTPFEGIWLPTSIWASGSVSTALNTISIRYSRGFSDYKEADVKVRLRFDPPDSPKDLTPRDGDPPR